MGQELPNKIRIPRLQRDYVQGLDPRVIIPFVEALLGKADIHLNYIYGPQPSPEMGFEPVDGQQRLTTLWLLRLCLSKVAGCPFFDVLSYTAREYADDFCRCLMGEKNYGSGGVEPAKSALVYQSMGQGFFCKGNDCHNRGHSRQDTSTPRGCGSFA